MAMAMASPRPSPATMASSPRPLDLEVTVVSAKHLKNVNWRHGDLKPYAVAYLDPERRLATKPDDGGGHRPIWNERLILPLPAGDPSLLLLTLDVFHSKPSETPKPLVGTARAPLADLIDLNAFVSGGACEATPIRTIELLRPSGRPQGKIRIRLAVRERPAQPPPPAPAPERSYHFAPPPTGYYYSTAPPPQLREYHRSFSSPSPPPLPPYASHPPPPQPSQYPYGNYSDPYSGYYPSSTSATAAAGFYSAPPMPVSSRPYCDRPASGYGGPSAPLDYSSSVAPSSSYVQRTKGSRMGVGTGLAVGAVAGALGGLALEEGLKYEEDRIADRVESDLTARDDYSDYRADY